MREAILKETLFEFEKFLMVKKGISSVTIGGYRGTVKRALKKFRTFDPTHEDIETYIHKMYEREYSYSHVVNTSLSLEWYMNFIKNPLKLGRPKKPRTIIKDVLTEAEITLLINASKNIREKAMVSILAYSGIRNGELCNLRVHDVNLGDNMVRVIKGKGQRDRMVNISGDCTRILLDYLREYPRKSDDHFFTTLKRHNKYSSHDLRKVIKNLARRAKLNKRVYPHLLRHSLATNLIRRGANITLVQRQLGHSFIETTMVYIRSFPQRIQNEYNLYIPSYL
ncbi:MAG: tyrosine-type recombinase/integrase [Patescibacteria group bacterium]|jgi:integrase/recombinase XerD